MSPPCLFRKHDYRDQLCQKGRFQTLPLDLGFQLVGTDSHARICHHWVRWLAQRENSRLYIVSHLPYLRRSVLLGKAIVVPDLHTWHRVHFTLEPGRDDRVGRECDRDIVTSLACSSVCRWAGSLSLYICCFHTTGGTILYVRL